MSIESESIEDIERLLALTWRPWGGIPLDPSSITRTWSLDLGWLTPESSESLLAKLIAKGWLVSSADGLTPKTSQEVEVPLGWFPRQRLLDDPPACPEQNHDESVPTSKTASVKIESTPEKKIIESIDTTTSNVSDDIPALLQSISSASGLSRQEVMRRAQRKRQSLGHITVWSALTLVARELGLDVAKLCDT